MAWTIFTVKTSDYIVLHSDNQAYWSTMERKFKQDLFTPDSPTEHSESGTPAPPPLPPLNILRFTTEHMPKDPGTGFVLGPIRTNATSSYITVGSQVSVDHIIRFYEFSVRGEDGPQLIMEFAACGSLLGQSQSRKFTDREG
ncbi:uncharacterized protein PODANS_5_10118 [Podospora anserina S mat+]|uniref:Podospora anserina S mat+ genomic DNA chromosome 5, supercontig 9 n=1 Tax=Podospora anserina (strain S / ATCC MYA-4624 / DSM 980 / FGSC 10383) TaxID=515849 RepID=B2ALB1_PODAN|nr:uncharacterized protein PODANS_5_10118 [Podospora anserina S mat+]CAP64749.1 unnamed protein product [Podospora anserina S mat+]CDP30148.1 Putative protein of unknown function [Podospora anserina S mat+]